MRLKTTIALLIMVLFGCIYIFLIDGYWSNTDAGAAHAGRSIRFDPDRVDRLEVEHGRDKLVCIRRNGDWFVAEPYQAQADSSVINRILASLYRMEHEVVISREQRKKRDLTLTAYGLLPPKAIVRFEGDNFRRLVNVGNLSYDGELIYVTLDNTKGDVYAVDTALWQALPLRFSDARSRQVFYESPSSINRIDVKTRSHGFVSLALNRSGEWMMTQPYEARADGRIVRELLDRICGLQFNSYVDGVAADNTLHGFEEIDLSISLRGIDDVLPREVLFGAALPADASMIYARYRGNPALFSVPSLGVSRLLSEFDPDRLRDRRVIDSRADEISAIRIGSDSEAMEFQLRGGVWTMTSPRRWNAEKSRLEALISDWSSATIREFIPDSDPENPVAISNAVSLAFATAPARRGDGAGMDDYTWSKLEIGEADLDRGLVPVRKNKAPWIYMVNLESRPKLPHDPLYFRDRTVLSIAANDIQSMTLRKSGREQSVARSPDNDRFMVVGPDNGRERRMLNQTRLLELVSSLRCARYLSSNGYDAAEYGLDEPHCALTLVLRGDAGISNTVLIGKSAGDGLRYARIRGQDVVFLLDDESVGIICSDLYITVEIQ